MSRMRKIFYGGARVSDGSVKVMAYVGVSLNLIEVGRMMPTRFDSRQQPKSLAMRLMEERIEKRRSAGATNSPTRKG